MTVATPAWDRLSTAVAGLVVGEIALAWMLAVRSVRLGGGAVALGIALAIGSVVMLTRCRLPAAIKAALLLGLVASVLGCMATQDALGAKAALATTDASLTDAAAHAADLPRVTAAGTAGSAGEQAAGALQAELADRGVTSDAGVALSPVDPAVFTDPYRVHWTLERGAERVWCGEYTIADRKRPDVALLADRVQDALAKSRGGPLSCD